MSRNLEPIYQFIGIHNQHKKADGLRMGQRFVNMYVKAPWPELFYTTDQFEAVNLIHDYLTRHQYHDTLPPRIDQPVVEPVSEEEQS